MNLFDYVMQTPANTNPAVLSSEISKAIEESQVQADYAQNDPSKKDYIKNRPIYVELEFVGNLHSMPSGDDDFEYTSGLFPKLLGGAKYRVYSDQDGKGNFLFAFSSTDEGDGSNYKTLWAKGEGKGFHFYSISGANSLVIDTKRFTPTLHPGFMRDYYCISVMKEIPKGKIYTDQLPVATYDTIGAIKAGYLGAVDTTRYGRVDIDDNNFLYSRLPIFSIASFNKNVLSAVPNIESGLGVIMAEGDASPLIENALGEQLKYPIFMGYTNYSAGSGALWVTLIGFSRVGQFFKFRYHYFPYDIENIEVDTLANHKTPYLTLESPNGTSYKVTVDDSGTLSATEITSET